MDPGVVIIWIAGMVSCILITGAIVWGVLQHARIEAQRKEADPALAGAVGVLRDQVEVLQQQLQETQERVDFTERLLTQGRVPDQLPRGG